jgi:hypothetical protein
VQVVEEALDLLALGTALSQYPGSREGVAPSDSLVGAEGAGPDHGPRGLLVHEGRRYGIGRRSHIVKIE